MANASLTRLPLALAGLVLGLVPAEALAGGIGLVTYGGAYSLPVYYYDSDGNQGIDSQQRPTYGGGVDFLIGDKDDKLVGLARVYMIRDTPPKAPEFEGADGEEYTWPAQEDEPPRKVGTLTMGAQWGAFGDPLGTQFVVTGMIGTGFASTDDREFVVAEPGVGVTHTIKDHWQFAANANLGLRYRKRITMGENVVVGVRYLFD
jgi:hypothetical protein